MKFASYTDLMKEAVSYYDDTDVIDTGWDLSTPHVKRIMHYINRAQEEIWYYRPWPWRMGNFDFTINAPNVGDAYLPGNFSNVGPNGLLLDEQGRPWAEISYQDMVVLRQRNQRTQDHLFCIGQDDKQWDADIPAATGSTGVYSASRKLMVPNTEQPFNKLVGGGYQGLFSLLYEMTAPLVDETVWAFPPAIPPGFHHTLLLGTVAKMQEGKGDGRSIWRSDYVATLAKLAAELEPLQSRPRQMPVTIGRMW
jgi:hypothetical protein